MTLPVLVTLYEYVTRVPGAEYDLMLADFFSAMDGYRQTGMHTEDWAVTLGPLGGVPVAVPVFWRDPRSTSLWVVV